MLYPAELRAHWSLLHRTRWFWAKSVGHVTVEVFAFGSEFFNTLWRVRGRLSAQSGFLAGFFAGGCSAALFMNRK